MAKKKGGSKKKSSAVSKETVQELPPEPEEMTLLYRKARFDDKSHALTGQLRLQYDGYHRKVTKGYCEFLRERRFWMAGDEIPDGVIPAPPTAAKPTGGGGRKGKRSKSLSSTNTS